VRAREIWEQNGRPSGRDEEFWLQAETEITEHSDLVCSECRNLTSRAPTQPALTASTKFFIKGAV